MEGSTAAKKMSTLSRCIRALSPVKALTRARDFYVRSMLGCAGKVTYGDIGAAGVPNLPRSFSTSSARSAGGDDDDMRELVRVASLKALRPKVDDGYKTSAGGRKMPRSCSLKIQRIDEDKPCSFREAEEVGDGMKGGSGGMFSRSRSYFPARRSVGF